MKIAFLGIILNILFNTSLIFGSCNCCCSSKNNSIQDSISVNEKYYSKKPIINYNGNIIRKKSLLNNHENKPKLDNFYIPNQPKSVSDKKNIIDENVDEDTNKNINENINKNAYKDADENINENTNKNADEDINENVDKNTNKNIIDKNADKDTNKNADENINENTNKNADKNVDKNIIDENTDENIIDENTYENVDEDINENADKNTDGNINGNTNENIDGNINGNTNENIDEKVDENIIDKNVDKNINENINGNTNENVDEDIIDKNVDKNINENINGNTNENVDEDIIDKNVDKNINENINGNTNENVDENLDKNTNKNVDKNVDENINEDINENIDENINGNTNKNVDKNLDKNTNKNVDGNIIDENTDENINKNINENTNKNINENVYENVDKNTDKNINENADENVEKFLNTSSENQINESKNSNIDSFIRSSNKNKSLNNSLSNNNSELGESSAVDYDNIDFIINNSGTYLNSCLKNSTSEKLDIIINKLAPEFNINERYQLIKDIGSGGFATIVLARDLNNNEDVVIKKIKKSSIKNIKDKIDLIRELCILKKITESYIQNKIEEIERKIISLVEICQDNEFYYIVQEYCKSGDMVNYLTNKNNKISKEDAACYFYQLIKGVDYIHSLGIAHRDLKPDNLLLTADYRLKICDFGISNFFNQKSILSKSFLGTRPYASPEILERKMYDVIKNDVYSCGIILYALMYMTFPFEWQSELADSFSTNTVNSYIKNVKSLNYMEEPDDEIKDLLKGMLKYDPKCRFSIEDIKSSEFYLYGEKIFYDRYKCKKK